MKDQLHDYDIFPKVIPVGKESEITIKPRGEHARFSKPEYTIAVRPIEEANRNDYPDRKNFFEFQASPNANGEIKFKFNFFSEQQYYIKVNAENFGIQLAVYALNADLCGRYPFRGDLHMHTNRSDGRQSPAIVAANYRKTGYDFLAITDHHRYYPSIEAIEFYKNVPCEFALIPGEEVHLPKDHAKNCVNDVHIVNFGSDYSINSMIDPCPANGESKIRSIVDNPPPVMNLEEWQKSVQEFQKSLNIPESFTTNEKFAYAACCWIFNEIRKANGLGIFCHPYWIANVFQVPVEFTNHMTKEHPFDAFEVLGGENYFEQNGFQTLQYYEDRAKGVNYAIVGSTDSHNSVNSRNSHLCSTLVFAPSCKREDLISSIKSLYTVAVDSISAEPRYVGTMRLVKYACFLEQEFFPLHDDLCFEEGRAMKDYANGDPQAEIILKAINGRMKKQREKYFGF